MPFLDLEIVGMLQQVAHKQDDPNEMRSKVMLVDVTHVHGLLARYIYTRISKL